MNLTKLILGLLTPVVAAASAWLVAALAKYGVHLDPSGVNALAVAGATAGAAAMVKLIHDVEHKPAVVAVVGDASKVAGSVDQALVAADPKAGQTLEDAVAEVQRAAEARFAELEAKIPQPPAPVATAENPAVTEHPGGVPAQPAPVVPEAAPVVPPPAV